MGCAVFLREDFDASTLRSLAKRTRDANQGRRLPAPAPARSCAVDRGGVPHLNLEAGAEPRAARDGLAQAVGPAPSSWAKRVRSGGVQKNFPAPVEDIARRKARGARIEIRFRDEARIGRKNTMTRRWAKRGTRPRAPHDRRTESAYVFGAICPKKGKGAGLTLPFRNAAAMALHLPEISQAVAPHAHAVPVMDQAGWHTSGKLDRPDTISILTLMPRAPELGPVENIRQFLRDNRPSNRIFTSHDDIVEHWCDAWNKIIDQP